MHRGVLRARASARRAPTRARARRCAALLNAPDAREIVFLLRGTTEAINLVAASFGAAPASAGRRDPHLGDGAPLEHRAVADGLRERAARSCVVAPIDDRGELVLDELEALLGPRTRLVAVAHVSNALGTVNPVREIVEIAPRARRAGAGRRRAGGAAPAGRRAGARLRLLRLLGPQDLRAVRHRRALRPPRAARGDAAVAGRRRDDRARVTLREDHLRRHPGALRGGHAEHRRRHRARRGDRLRRRRSASSAIAAHEQRAARLRDRRCCARFPGSASSAPPARRRACSPS